MSNVTHTHTHGHTGCFIQLVKANTKPSAIQIHKMYEPFCELESEYTIQQSNMQLKHDKRRRKKGERRREK